ncbi:DUF4132 domain-containing protein [Kitasatospora phosalacinea]|uniref:DUF4132 domain-containing protein n=1 Tax=Kitasatospora phosalacinea TaxID=2065 RepID=UPI00052593A9|nr:DUF4132 domain-containing protein [Kitasatospora phosalacinea]
MRQGEPVGGGSEEDAFAWPAAWHSLVLPRRGGGASSPAAWPGPAAVAAEDALIDGHRDWFDRVCAAGDSAPELVRAARAYLGGAPDALGAAAVAAMLPPLYEEGAAGGAVLVDAWTARHGLAFAARAAVATLEVDFWRSAPGYAAPCLMAANSGSHGYGAEQAKALCRARHLLSVADEPAHLEALAAVGAERSGGFLRRVGGAYLFPTAPGWVDAWIDELPRWQSGPLRSLLVASLGSRAQVERLVPVLDSYQWSAESAATAADGLGTDAVPLLAGALRRLDSGEAAHRLAELILEFPGDEAFGALLGRVDDRSVAPVLWRAAERYPVRALRLLAAAARDDGVTARHLLDRLLRSFAGKSEEVLSRLDPATAAFVRALPAAGPAAPEAGEREWPAVLASPPWERPRPTGRPVVLELPADESSALCWQEGERESWTAEARESHDWRVHPEDTDWAVFAPEAFRTARSFVTACRLLWQAPVEVMSPLLPEWRPPELYHGLDVLRPVVAKYGPAAVPVALHTARMRPAQLAPLLLPVLDVAAARLMAQGLSTRKSVRATARSWFARHGVAGALLLVPDAVGKAGPARTAAGQALRLAAGRHGAGAVTAAAAGRYGERAAEAVAAVLAVDPLVEALPARLPRPPSWPAVELLPPLPLRSGAVLPEPAVRRVLTMMALAKAGTPYPGLALVAEECAPGAWAAFCWAVFEEWRLAGMPAEESWALTQLGVFGDDGTARRLAPLLRQWPRQKAARWANEGLDVLAAIGTDVALGQLHGIAQRVRQHAVRVRAQEKIAEIALELRLTPEQLADRLVPDLGLDADGTTRLDYGPRSFTVALDPQLRPYLVDGSGKRRTAVPAPTAKDDPELAPAARKRYAALKKELHAVGAEQIARLETAMVAQRAWSAAEFTSLLLAHPLLGQLTRRLLWTAEQNSGPDADGRTAFRVAEDRTFADVRDEPFALPADAVVRLAHPALLGGDLAPWAELFTDYLVIQPFPQLGRPVCALTPGERAVDRLERFEGRTAGAEALRALVRRGSGWAISDPDQDGLRRFVYRRLPGGLRLSATLDPGLHDDPGSTRPEQAVREVWLGTRPGEYRPGGSHRRSFAELDAVTACELLADLGELTGAA